MARIRGTWLIGVIAALALGAATVARERQPPPTYPIAQAPESFRPAVQRADTVIATLRTALRGRYPGLVLGRSAAAAAVAREFI